MMAKINLKDYLERLEEPEDREAVASREYQRELFEQYVQKGTNFPELRAQLLEEYRAGAELTGPQGLRRKLGAVDLGYFGRAYLPHYFVRPSPPFHEELDRIFREGVMKGLNPATDAKEISRADGCRRAVEAPRGHAKSTNFTFKDSIHSAVYAYKHYEIILSDSSEQAEGFLSDIKTELEENAALREDFGELVGRVWKASVILLSNGVKIEALGAGKKIRGRRHKQWRPDLILCDDLENDENVNTPEQRKKLRDWFYKAVSKAGDTYTDIVYIGTLLHYDALLANVAKNPEYEAVRYKGVISFATNTALWDAWERIFTDLENPRHKEDAEDFFKANEAAMLEGTAVLWEEKLPYVAKPYNGGGFMDEITLKDEMLLLEETQINNTFLDTTPQEMISYFLAQAGLSKMKLSATGYPERKRLPIRQMNVIEAINAVHAAWNIKQPFFFSGGVFYWGEKPEQEKTYIFEYGVNIIALTRIGGAWELETVSAPFVRHSHKISVKHPKVSGEFEVAKVVSATNDDGFIRTKIYF